MTAVRTVALIPHLDKKEVVPKILELIQWLEEHQIKVKLLEEDALSLRQEKLGFTQDVVVHNVDLILVLGGDGTILRAVRLLEGKDILILGVNFGKFGFLCEVEVPFVFDYLKKVLNNEFEVERRNLLSCRIFQNKELVLEKRALNDLVVSRKVQNKLLNLEVYINENFFYRYPGDGLIVSSPTGATAYSFSAGGPWISPENQVMVMTPICPHTLFNRSLVLSEEDKVSLKFPNTTTDKVAVSIDGVFLEKVNSFNLIEILLSKERVSLVRFGRKDFYSLLRKKFEG